MQWSRGFCPLPSAAAFLWRHVAFSLLIHRIIQWSVSLPPTIPPSLLQRPPAFQLSSSLSSDPSARPSPSLPPSPLERVELVSFLYRLLPFLPSASIRPASSERAPPRTDQPANGQTVGRSLFRCHRGRPERAKHVSEGVSGLAVSETV